jgi:hypothetical protein
VSYNPTAPTFAAGEVVTAAKLNDLADGITAAWTAYTPTWSGPTPPTLGNGTIVGAYLRIGKSILFRLQLTWGSTTTPGVGNWVFGLPAAAHAAYTSNTALGKGLAVDTSVPAFSSLVGGVVGSTTIYAVTAGGLALAPAVPYTWAAGDKISLDGVYEAA